MKHLKKYIKKNFSNFSYFYSLLQLRLIVVIVFSMIVGFLDSLGLTMFLPLLQLADGDNLVDMGNLSFITDVLNSFNIVITIPKALLFLVVIFILKGLVIYQSNIYKLKNSQILSKKVREEFIVGFRRFNYNQFVKTDHGKIQNIFMGEVARLTAVYSNYITMIQGLIMIVIYMSFSIVVDWKFSILVIFGGVLSNIIFLGLNKLTKERSRDISKFTNVFNNFLLQYVSNFKYLKASGNITKYSNKVIDSLDDVQYAQLQIGILNAKLSSFREPILILIVCLIIFLQVIFFDARIASIMISLLFFYRALTSVISVQQNYNSTISNQGAIDNILSFKEELFNNLEPLEKLSYNGFEKSIKIKNLNMFFDNFQVLKNINLEIFKNQTTAFVGESGSGKTTLVNNLIKISNPNSGSILLDDKDINEYNHFSYQSKIGYISQEPAIFNDTIFNNVTFWSEKNDETIEKFNLALKKASIFDFVNSLDDKEDSMLGSYGVNLSGGQRQRVSIARELYKDTEILILDEATSALDSQTEKDIQDNIDDLKGEVTIIIIAHRLSTIRKADVIYLMSKGEVIDKGKFEELNEKNLKFRNMVNLQEI